MVASGVGIRREADLAQFGYADGVAAFVAWMWQFPEARGGHEPVLCLWLPDVHGGVEHRNLAPLLATTTSLRLVATTSTHVTRLADLILSILLRLEPDPHLDRGLGAD